MKNIILGCIISLQLLLVPTAFSHHSTAEYDFSTVAEIEGELVSIDWRNPHVRFTVSVAGPNNEFEDWNIESGAVYLLERGGLDTSMFTPGMQIKVAGSPSRFRNAMQPTNILLPNSEEIQLFNSKGYRWNQDAVGGQLFNQEVDRSELGLFRVWSLDETSWGEYRNGSKIIADARFVNADDQSNPSYDSNPCEPQGMPGIMSNPLPIQFIDQGDYIDLQISSFSILRKVYLNNSNRSDSAQVSMYGVSTGSYSDGVLEIHTTQIDWPYIDDAGRPLSPNAEVFEKYTIAEGGNKLTYTQTISDPEVLVEPVTIGWGYIDIGEETIKPLFCEG